MRLMLVAGALVILGGILLVATGSEEDEKSPRESAAGYGVQAPSATVVNAMCPIMPEMAVNPARVPPEPSSDIPGASVGFCCADCVPKWRALAEDQRRDRLAAVLND